MHLISAKEYARQILALGKTALAHSKALDIPISSLETSHSTRSTPFTTAASSSTLSVSASAIVPQAITNALVAAAESAKWDTIEVFRTKIKTFSHIAEAVRSSIAPDSSGTEISQSFVTEPDSKTGPHIRYSMH